MRPFWRRWQGAALLLALGGACWLLFVRSIRGGGPLVGDESFHAMWAIRTTADLRDGQLLALAYDTYRQVYWPPAFSWMLGVILLLTHPTDAIARSAGLLGFAGLALALYSAGRLLAAERRHAHAVGLVCVAAGATAGGVLSHATQVMLDVPAAALLACGLSWYFRLLRPGRSSLPEWGALGALIVATFLMKQNYGVLLGLAVAGSFIVDGQWLRRPPTPEALDQRWKQAASAGVLATLLVIWFGYPQKVVQTIQGLINSPFGPDRFSLDGLLFFPRQMVWLAGSWLLLAAWILATAASLRRSSLQDSRIRTLLIFVGFQFVFAELAQTKLARYLIPLAPVLAMLTAAQAERLWQIRRPPLRVLGKAAISLVLIGHAVIALRSLPGPPGPAGGELLNVLSAEARRDGPTLIIGSIDIAANPAAIDWRLIGDRTLSVDAAGSLLTASERRFADGPLPRLPAAIQHRIRPLVDRWPGASGHVTLYVGWPLDPSLQLRAGNLQATVRGILARRSFDRIVVVVGATRNPEVTFTSKWAAEQLRPLGYEAEREPLPVEGVDVHFLRRMPSSR